MSVFFKGRKNRNNEDYFGGTSTHTMAPGCCEVEPYKAQLLSSKPAMDSIASSKGCIARGSSRDTARQNCSNMVRASIPRFFGYEKIIKYCCAGLDRADSASEQVVASTSLSSILQMILQSLRSRRSRSPCNFDMALDQLEEIAIRMLVLVKEWNLQGVWLPHWDKNSLGKRWQMEGPNRRA